MRFIQSSAMGEPARYAVAPSGCNEESALARPRTVRYGKAAWSTTSTLRALTTSPTSLEGERGQLAHVGMGYPVLILGVQREDDGR